jgi:hypothetical protein
MLTAGCDELALEKPALLSKPWSKLLIPLIGIPSRANLNLT